MIKKRKTEMKTSQTWRHMVGEDGGRSRSSMPLLVTQPVQGQPGLPETLSDHKRNQWAQFIAMSYFVCVLTNESCLESEGRASH